MALGGHFWPVLRELARTYADDRVYLLVVAPDGDSYYAPEYGVYPAAVLSSTASEDEYWETISEEPGGDVTGALAFSAEVVAFTGDSGEWGCWAESGYEIAAVQGWPATLSPLVYVPLLNAVETLEDFVSLAFYKHGVPRDFASAFLANYK